MPANRKLKLRDERLAFKPFNYPWAFSVWKQHEQMHWLPDEVPLLEDVKEWTTKLNESERQFLTHIFRFFTQADVDVAGGYVNNFLPTFPQPEVRCMLLGFAAREAVHIAAYSHLIETLGMPDIYSEFLQYKEMTDKHDYLRRFQDKSDRNVAQQLALFSAFTEGLQLFSSFVMLLNFPRQGKMRGMGQIITWSIRDESAHVDGMIQLFRTFIEENRHIWKDDLKKELYDIASNMVLLEDQFIDLAFDVSLPKDLAIPEMGVHIDGHRSDERSVGCKIDSGGRGDGHEDGTAQRSGSGSGNLGHGITGLDPNDLKQYIRYIADRRLIQMGLKGMFKVKKNPLPWVDEMINAPVHSNFFEARSTDYGKGCLTGSWSEVWA